MLHGCSRVVMIIVSFPLGAGIPWLASGCILLRPARPRMLSVFYIRYLGHLMRACVSCTVGWWGKVPVNQTADLDGDYMTTEQMGMPHQCSGMAMWYVGVVVHGAST